MPEIQSRDISFHYICASLFDQLIKTCDITWNFLKLLAIFAIRTSSFRDRGRPRSPRLQDAAHPGEFNKRLRSVCAASNWSYQITVHAELRFTRARAGEFPRTGLRRGRERASTGVSGCTSSSPILETLICILEIQSARPLSHNRWRRRRLRDELLALRSRQPFFPAPLLLLLYLDFPSSRVFHRAREKAQLPLDISRELARVYLVVSFSFFLHSLFLFL